MGKTIAVLLLALTVALPFQAEATPEAASKLLSKIYDNPRISIDEKVENLDPDTRDQVVCLALNLYHEARGSTKADLYAVGFVTKNRVNSDNHADTYCAVIWEKQYGVTQFSWTKQTLSHLLPKEKASWRRCLEIAYQIVTDDDLTDTTHGAKSFFNPVVVTPKWAVHAKKRTRIGAHVYVVPNQ